MTFNKKSLKNIFEALLGLAFVFVFLAIVNNIDAPEEEGEALFFFSAYFFILLGFLLGVLRRKYFFLGLLPFVVWFTIIRFLLPGWKILMTLSLSNYFDWAGFLAILLFFGWVPGFILSIGGRWGYQYWKRMQDKKTEKSETM